MPGLSLDISDPADQFSCALCRQSQTALRTATAPAAHLFRCAVDTRYMHSQTRTPQRHCYDAGAPSQPLHSLRPCQLTACCLLSILPLLRPLHCT